MWVYPQILILAVCAKCNDGGSWGGWHVSNVIPTLQRLDIGSIQHLMTLQRYTDTFLASHYSDIHVSIPPDPAILDFEKCNDGGSWGGWHVSNVIPTLQRLDIGSIQHLMTLQRYTDTFLASHYSDIHVSIPPDPDFGTFSDLKVQWWWQLRWMTCLKCHPNSSKAWYRVHTTFDDPTKIYRHLSGITLQRHSCEYTPRSWFCYFLDLKGANGGSWGGWHVSNVIPTLQRLDIGSIQHLMTLQRYTDTFLASHYSDIHVSIPPDPDFGSLRKVQWWWQLRWMTCLKCHPNSSKAWYRVHTTFDDPTKIYRHLSGITLQRHSCEYTPRSCYFGLEKCNDGGSWGGWHVSNVIPTLQRLDIGSIQHLMTLQRYTDTFLASHYSDIHVSIPPDPDFGTLRKVQWWWQLRWMTCLKCHPNSSKAWYRVHTTFDDPTKIYRHLSGITLQRHSCEYTPRFCYFGLERRKWWWQLRWMTCLKCHPNSSKAWYRVHTTFDDPTKIYRHLSGITLQRHSCEYTPDPILALCAKCNDGGSWGGWHVSNVIPTLQRLDIGSIQHLMTLQRYTDTFLASHYSDIHVSIPPDPAILDFAQSAMMVAVEVDDMSQMSSQLFKGLI